MPEIAASYAVNARAVTFPLVMVARIYYRGSRLLRDSYFNVGLSARYVDALPTLEQSLGEKNNTPRPRVIADNNVGLDITRHLRRNGFDAVSLRKTNAAHAADEHIFDEARRLGAIILTQDNDFKNPRRFDLRESPGVVILPVMSNISNTLKQSLALRLAVGHFINEMPQKAKEWRSKVVKYTRDGKIYTYTPPFTPTRHGYNSPTMTETRYFPQPT